MRNRLYWKCKHYNETQFSQANPENKATHLRDKHGIVKDSNQDPIHPISRYIQLRGGENTPVVVGRQKESYVSLTSAVLRQPLLNALITLLVVCQLAFTLATNHLFIAFLKTIFPTIEQLMPKSATTIRKYVLLAFEKRRGVLKLALRCSKSQIHFSFDLWTSPNHLALLGIVGHYIDEFGFNRLVCFSLHHPPNFTSQFQIFHIFDSYDFLI